MAKIVKEDNETENEILKIIIIVYLRRLICRSDGMLPNIYMYICGAAKRRLNVIDIFDIGSISAEKYTTQHEYFFFFSYSMLLFRIIEKYTSWLLP